MVIHTAFNIISLVSWQQLTLFVFFPGFKSTRLGLLSVLPKDTPSIKPRRSSAAGSQDPWIMSQTLYHWASKDLKENLYRSKFKVLQNINLIWLAVLGFNATLTAKVILSWRSVTHIVFPGFLTPVLTQLFFPKPQTTFLTCFCRGTWEAKICWKESLPQPGNELTTTRSWSWHAHHWATQAGHTSLNAFPSNKF